MKLRTWLAMLSLCVARHAGAQAGDPFPHAAHAKLFPVCSSCHASIATGDSAKMFPSPSLCASCHNGTAKPRVAWAGRARHSVGLLAFSHQAHAGKSANTVCETCHAADAGKRMTVTRPPPERCASCHAHGANAHLDERNACGTCHRTLVKAAGLTEARIASLPHPVSHARADFQATHGASARANPASCATCHARESCQRCHVDGARQPAIAALAPDGRVAHLMVGRPATYAVPADHRERRFALLHGGAAKANIARCATCHARASCESCHTGEGAPSVIRGLPEGRDATAPGVQLRPTPILQPLEIALVPAPPAALASITQMRGVDTAVHVVRVHPPGFPKAHGAAAASGVQLCSSCHSKTLCASCHTGERTTRRYHTANFVATHAPQAYSRETDCSSCHSTEAFCRDCHRQTGLAAKAAARSTVFHNAQPLWLLQHGRAARQDLKSCTTCHQQTYCMQCHSDLGARVNPHGADFNAARMAAKNPALCLYCHLKNPLDR